MLRWLVFGERRAEQSPTSAATLRPAKMAGRRRQRPALESLEERLTMTASLAGGIHSAAIISQTTPQIGTGVATIGVAASTTQASYGQSVVLSSTVAPAVPGGPTPTGNVTFFDGPAFLGTAPLVNGKASLSTWSVFLVGFNSVKAAYWGDANYTNGDSNYLNVQVSKTATVTSLSTAVSPSSVTFSATVAPAGPYSGTPSGVVGFFEDGTLVDSVLLVNGKATMTQAMNGSGNHTFTATYYGDSGFNGSTSNPPTVQALAVHPTHTILAVKPYLNAHGAAVAQALYAGVIDATTGARATSGTVTFYVDGKALKTVAVTNGMAATFAPLKSAKGHRFTAIYHGASGLGVSSANVVL